MKLQRTKLCVNCESVYEGNGPCPTCTSRIFIWLYPVLGTVLAPDGSKIQYQPALEGNFKALGNKVASSPN